MSPPKPGYLCSAADAEAGGLYACRLHESGRLELGSHVPFSGATFLALGPEGDCCYVAREGEEPQVVACRLDDLAELNRQPAGGGAPAYVSVDATGRYVFVANYLGGTVRVFPVDDGALGDPVETVAHEGSSVHPDRQTAPHPHCVLPGPDNRFVYVADLGTDEVRVYAFDAATGSLTPAATVTVHDGAGPRHLTVHPDGSTAYLLAELDATLTVFDRDRETGDLVAVQTVETLPEGYDGDNLAADVHVHPSGEWLYASNRGHDSVAVFAVDGDGRVARRGHESTHGEYPRNVALDPAGEFLFAENERSDSVVTFEVDPDSGALSSAGHTLSVPRPMCLAFVAGE